MWLSGALYSQFPRDLSALLLTLPGTEQGNLSQGKKPAWVDGHVALTCPRCAFLSPLQT